MIGRRTIAVALAAAVLALDRSFWLAGCGSSAADDVRLGFDARLFSVRDL